MALWLRSDHPTYNRTGHQWHELDAIVDAALAAPTLEEQQRLIAEADMYAIEKHMRISGPVGPQFYIAQPWLIGYNGEMDSGALGGGEFYVQYARFWIDSEMKDEGSNGSLGVFTLVAEPRGRGSWEAVVCKRASRLPEDATILKLLSFRLSAE